MSMLWTCRKDIVYQNTGSQRRRPTLPGRAKAPGTQTGTKRSNERRRGSLRRMPDLLGRLLGPAAKRRGLAEARLLTDWARIIGPEIAKHCQPVGLTRDGLLQLHVSGNAALEVQHSELQIVERINMFFGRPTVTRLRLRQAPRPRRTLIDRAPPPLKPLSSEEQEVITKTVETVADPDLRKALEALGGTLRQQQLLKKR